MVGKWKAEENQRQVSSAFRRPLEIAEAIPTAPTTIALYKED
jgi:hypothetical protein